LGFAERSVQAQQVIMDATTEQAIKMTQAPAGKDRGCYREEAGKERRVDGQIQALRSALEQCADDIRKAIFLLEKKHF